jgi:hypothetical protein
MSSKEKLYSSKGKGITGVMFHLSGRPNQLCFFPFQMADRSPHQLVLEPNFCKQCLARLWCFFWTLMLQPHWYQIGAVMAETCNFSFIFSVSQTWFISIGYVILLCMFLWLPTATMIRGFFNKY